MKSEQPGCPFIFLGVLFTFASSWFALVFTPYVQLQYLQPVDEQETGDVYPIPLGGLAAVGEQVYARNGCIYCHSQQVRPRVSERTLSEAGDRLAGRSGDAAGLGSQY